MSFFGYSLRGRDVPKQAPEPDDDGEPSQDAMDITKTRQQRIMTMETSAPGAHDRWMREPISRELSTVPGIGSAGRTALEAVGIKSTHMLIGKYLMFDRDENKFIEWLSGFTSISSYRTTIARAIAEKIAVSFEEW
jgi:hypothetical protein